MYFGNTEVVPVYYCTFTLFSIVGGSITYKEFAGLSLMQGVCFGCDICCALCGVIVITSGRAEEEGLLKESRDSGMPKELSNMPGPDGGPTPDQPGGLWRVGSHADPRAPSDSVAGGGSARNSARTSARNSNFRRSSISPSISGFSTPRFSTLEPVEKMDVLRARGPSLVGGVGIGAAFAQVRVSIDAHAAQKQRMSRANRISMDGSSLLSPIPFKRPSAVSIAEGQQIG